MRLGRLRRAVRVVRQHRVEEVIDVLAAQAALLRARRRLRRLPQGAFIPPAEEARALAPTRDVDEQRARRLAVAVERASRLGVIRPLCLCRAMALSDLLDRHGVRGHQIRIGVRHNGRDILAHAWVELGTAVLGDTVRGAGAYVPLVTVRLATTQ